MKGYAFRMLLSEVKWDEEMMKVCQVLFLVRLRT